MSITTAHLVRGDLIELPRNSRTYGHDAFRVGCDLEERSGDLQIQERVEHTAVAKMGLSGFPNAILGPFGVFRE